MPVLKYLTRAFGGKSRAKAAWPIIFSETEYHAWPDEPQALVRGIRRYVDTLEQRGQFHRSEICAEARQAVSVAHYMDQVRAHGHAGFVSHTRAYLQPALQDLLQGLEALSAGTHLEIVRKLSRWVHKNPREVANLTAGTHAADLAELDATFEKHEAQTPLDHALTAWILRFPCLRVVPDSAYEGEMNELIERNPKRLFRDTCLQIARLHDQLVAHPGVGISLAMGQVRPAEVALHVGPGAMVDVNGDQRMGFGLRTSHGLRWAVIQDDHVAIHEITEPATSVDIVPEAGATDLDAWRLPVTGAEIARADSSHARKTADLICDLKAAAAVHILLQRLPQIPSIDFAVVREASASGFWIFLAIHDAAHALLCEIDHTGAKLREAESLKMLVSVTPDEIDAFSRDHTLEAAAA